MDPLAVLDSALDQVSRLQENVSQAVLPSGGQPAVQCLAAAEQNVQQLQQLSAQLQRLTAAVQQAAPPVTQPSRSPQQAWANSVQQQAKQAADALQQHVTAALSGGAHPGALLLPHHAPFTHADRHTLWHLLQRVRSAAPSLAVHLFRSASDRMLCSLESGSSRPVDPDKRQPMDTAAVSHISAYVDEVRVVCPGVFVAAIGISPPGSLQPVRVCVDSVDRASTVDPWSSSKHQVFKRISTLAVRALLHFNKLQAAHTLLAPTTPDGATDGAGTGSASSSSGSSADGVALEALLLWLACFQDLFSRPCVVSGKVLTWAPGTATPLPPYVRPFWLSLDGLREAAANKAARQAFHAHLAPWPPSDPEAAAAAAAAAVALPAQPSAAAEAGVSVEVLSNGSIRAPAAVQAVAAAGSTAAVQEGDALAPWDTVEFTDDELREQLRHVIGGLPP